MNTLHVRRRLFAVVMVSIMAPALFLADLRASEAADRHDHDRARHALQQGEVRPIAEILRRVAAEVLGEVIEVELDREKRLGTRRWVYEIKLIAPDGRLVEVLVDASTAEILAVEDD